MAEFVSVHHRISEKLHRRLKEVSLASRQPVTEITNQALREWLERYETGFSPAKRPYASATTLLSNLRLAKQEGNFYESLTGHSKAALVDIAKHLNQNISNRMSRDRIAAVLHDAI